MIRSARRTAFGGRWDLSLVSLGHVLAATLLTACGDGQQEKGRVVGLVQQSPDEPFNVALRKSAIRRANDLRFTLRIFAPPEPGEPAELETVQRAIASGVSALVLANDQPSVLGAALDSGLPTIRIDTYPGDAALPAVLEDSRFLTQIGSDHERGGYLGCRALDDSIRSTAAGTVYLLSGPSPAGPVALRLSGCERYLSDLALETEFTVVERELGQASTGAARAEVRELLLRDPQITGLFAPTPEIGLGAAQALAEANAHTRVHLVVFDATSAVAAAVRQGRADAVIAQNAPLAGELAAEAAAASFRGISDLPAKIDTGFVIITSSSGPAQTERYTY